MKRYSFLVISAAAAAVLCIAPLADELTAVEPGKAGTGGMPYIVRLLGESRSIISSMMIAQADRYFHGGVGHMFPGHEEECPICSASQEEAHHAGRPLSGSGGVPGKSLLFRAAEEINVGEHRHLQGDEIKEMIPWLYYAFKLDPSNEQAYVLAGYYISSRLDRPEEGLKLLREGVKYNPGSWKINAEIGRIYLEEMKDPDRAVIYLSRAGKFLFEIPHDKFQERTVLSMLAHAYEEAGRPSRAVPFYRRLYALFPDTELYRRKAGNVR
ncbi:MAG: hypothetical protein GF408_04890 [Candidatus Omnitrophica bacterium]|nr:hypothetical protein [Candidatus Omnitrophota bacterium]